MPGTTRGGAHAQLPSGSPAARQGSPRAWLGSPRAWQSAREAEAGSLALAAGAVGAMLAATALEPDASPDQAHPRLRLHLPRRPRSGMLHRTGRPTLCACCAGGPRPGSGSAPGNFTIHLASCFTPSLRGHGAY